MSLENRANAVAEYLPTQYRRPSNTLIEPYCNNKMPDSKQTNSSVSVKQIK